MDTKKQKQMFLQVFEKSLGVISAACKASNISRQTYYIWIANDPEFAEQVKEINEQTLDFAESKLFKAIDNVNVTAIIFFLKNKGKSRGYQNEIDGQLAQNTPQKIEISILNPKPDEDSI
jgi:hypothetical protein